ncbi:hypothetical protein MIMGU_mgv1a025515mg [Erythranthe guttata]|uniref:Uncharacterized protein n=1 Tax=Erythranthe guttata TaxID=4155 RepID=A0A022R1R0_ERYGU|nr:hypothetical protein MIMGU_mgv1a025515mg [Erythranthe guttata]
MGVVIESEFWEPNQSICIFLFIFCVLSIFLLPTKSAANVLDHAPHGAFLRFQRKFLLLYALSSEQMVTFLLVGYAASLSIGSFLGMISDLVGHKKLCLLFYLLHLFVSISKIVIGTPTICFTSIFLALASSIFSFKFRVVDGNRLGQRQDSLNDMFWLMTFFESASFISSQVLANYFVDGNVFKNVKSVWSGASVLAFVGILFVTRGGKEARQTASVKDHHISLHRHATSGMCFIMLIYAKKRELRSIAILDDIKYAPHENKDMQ